MEALPVPAARPPLAGAPERRRRRPTVEEEPLDETPLAFIGVRACELHAIEIQDRVFLGGAHVDRDYAARRDGAFLVAVNCFEPGGTCFCASMGTGPKVESGYDLALTELLDGEHRFLVEAGTERGAEVLAELPGRRQPTGDLDAAAASVESAAGRMGRTMETFDLRDLLARNLEHPRWDDVAERCLTCGNCTLVCPTCFCSAVEDETDLSGGEAERWRVWDTCFSVDYSYIHGGSIRPSDRSRYRQWMTHKLGTWHDQFGSSGCVGCGRCITWCPVGIDITEEVAAIRATEERRCCDRLRRVLADVPFLGGLEADAARAARRLRRQRSLRRRRARSSARATPPTRSIVVRHGSVALETFVPDARAAS